MTAVKQNARVGHTNVTCSFLEATKIQKHQIVFMIVLSFSLISILSECAWRRSHRRPLFKKFGLRRGCFRFEACDKPFEISKDYSVNLSCYFSAGSLDFL